MSLDLPDPASDNGDRTEGAPVVRLVVNGETHRIAADPTRRLSDVLREELGLFGTKVGCDAGDCGACTVLLDGAPVCACLTAAAQAEGRRIETVESTQNAALERLRASFARHGAAQCGICTPGMLMAAAALLSEVEAPDAEQVDAAIGGVLCRCTGYTKIIAAVVDAGRGAEARDDSAEEAVAFPVSGHAVGARIARLDGEAKVTGDERFGADWAMPDMLDIRAVRSPWPHAGFSFGDLAAWAKETPGVVGAFTAADLPGRNSFGVIEVFSDQPAFAERETRFRGEVVAIVVGEPDAMAALDLADFPVEWRELPAAMEPEAAMTPEAPQLHVGRDGNLLTRGFVRQGDVEAALGASRHVVEGGMRTAYVEHAYIEPEAGVGWVDGEVVTVRACTQAPGMDREALAEMLDLPMDRVRVLPAATGGGFGSKLDVSLQPYLGLAALKTGRPVRMVYTRAESLQSTTKRHPGVMSARIGCDDEGRVTAMGFEGVFNTGAYASWGPTVANRVPVHASGPYRAPNYRAEGLAIHTHGPISGAFRGFGVPQAAILQETLYDRLAEAAEKDRLAFRILNAFRLGDHTATGQALNEGCGIVDCLEALKEPWERALTEAEARNAKARWNGAPERWGVGVASCWYGCGNTSLPNPSTIKFGLTAGGVPVLHQGAVDIGQGSNTVIAQIAADAAGFPLERLRLVDADTARTPDAGKTSASRQTYVTGRAAEAAGRALRALILRAANVDDSAELILGPGVVIARQGDAERRIDLASLPADAEGYVFRAEEQYDPPTTALDENGQGVPYAVYGWGAQIAEVRVDTRLGTVAVERLTAAHDVGRAINPMLCEGQIEGGVAQGLGLALMEEYLPGRTENLHDYLIPTSGDMPEIRTMLIERPDPEGPFGAKGLGEHALIPTAPAILNAIRHACGAEITQVPALPHRVLAAIEAARAAGREI